MPGLLCFQELLAPVPAGLEADLAKLFPPPVHDMLALGHARMLDDMKMPARG